VSIGENLSIVRRAFFYTPLYKWCVIIAFQLTADFHDQPKVKFLVSRVGAAGEDANHREAGLRVRGPIHIPAAQRRCAGAGAAQHGRK
jgi:hypothetical protein